jgi:hypothetical protein
MSEELDRDFVFSPTVGLIASHSNLFSRNLAIFATVHGQIELFCCNENPLRNAEFINKVYIFQDHKDCDANAQNLINFIETIEELPEMILFEDDDWLFQVSRSEMDTTTKLKLLPIKNQNRFFVAGSKIEQVELFEELHVNYPKSEIVQPGKMFPKSWSFPYLVKGERGAGGLEVAVIQSQEQLQNFSRKNNSKFLMQEIIEGDEYSVDAFFRKGNLVFACIAVGKAAMWKFGPCSFREYQREIPIQIEIDLKKIGKELMFDGIANVSFMRQKSSGDYFLFEFDSRLTIWAHVAIDFGFNPDHYFSNSLEMKKTISRNCVYVSGPRWNKYLKEKYRKWDQRSRIFEYAMKVKVRLTGGKYIA